MEFGELDIGKILVDESYLSEEVLEKAKIDAEHHRVNFVDLLLSEGIISRDLLGQGIAEHVGRQYADLSVNTPDSETIKLLPSFTALNLRVIVMNVDETSVIATTDNLQTDGIVTALQEQFPGKDISITYTLPDDIDKHLQVFKKQFSEIFSTLVTSEEIQAPKIVEAIVKEAKALKVSDIHFDPQEDQVIVRFRMDGVLQKMGVINETVYSAISNRIKILANMRIDEHNSAQDGSFQLVDEEQKTDMRVSIIPTIKGEKIVIRLFDDETRDISLNELGFSPHNQSVLIDAASKPFGMVLVTGPTGSGKTTTLYSLLRKFNDSDVNIMTIEDPVEYRIKGINQVQVIEETNLTFANGLRSLMRQDPDILLVGEIRDTETAEIAVNAALTGHLLYSTFHANDAATAIPRLIDMGIEPYLLASTLELVIGQRLIRNICNTCRYSYTVSREEVWKKVPYADRYFSDEQVTLYKGKGCASCAGLGYKGRSAIIELLKVTDRIGSIIISDPSSNDIWNIAREEGSRTLFEDGIDKVKTGTTSLEELLRVAEPPVYD